MFPFNPVTRTAVFLDSDYLARVFKSVLPGARPDYRYLAHELHARAAGIHTIFFYGAHPYASPHPTELELLRRDRIRRIFGSIAEIPRFEMRLGAIERCADASHPSPLYYRARVHSMFTHDLLSLAQANEISRALIIADDGLLAPAVEDARDVGIHVHIFHGRGPCRPDDALYLACDERTPIERAFVERVMLRPPG